MTDKIQLDEAGERPRRKPIFELRYKCGCRLESYGSAELYEYKPCLMHQEKMRND